MCTGEIFLPSLIPLEYNAGLHIYGIFFSRILISLIPYVHYFLRNILGIHPLVMYGLFWLSLILFSKYIKFLNEKIELKSLSSSLLMSPILSPFLLDKEMIFIRDISKINSEKSSIKNNYEDEDEILFK